VLKVDNEVKTQVQALLLWDANNWTNKTRLLVASWYWAVQDDRQATGGLVRPQCCAWRTSKVETAMPPTLLISLPCFLLLTVCVYRQLGNLCDVPVEIDIFVVKCIVVPVYLNEWCLIIREICWRLIVGNMKYRYGGSKERQESRTRTR
jgi:hypothetical protein